MATKKKRATKRYTVKVTLDKRKIESLFSRATVAAAFDEWMRRYIADPSAFAAEFQTVAQFTTGSRVNGASYGEGQADYLIHLLVEQATKRVMRAVRTRAVRK